MTLQRLAVYAAAAIVPPVGIGLMIALSALSSAMIHDAPAPLAAPSPAAYPATLKKTHFSRRAVIALSASGSEVTEVLGSYELLAATGAYEVKTAASTRDPVKTTSDLAVVPDLSFSEVRGGDLLIVPSSVDPTDRELIGFVTAKAPDFRLVVVCGEAARLAVQTPLLAGKDATSHFLAASDLGRVGNGIHWRWGPRSVRDGAVLTTAGLGATLDGVLEAIAITSTESTAEHAAAETGWSWTRSPEEGLQSLSPGELFGMLFRAGYDWSRPQFASIVYTGESELALAAVLDTFPRSYTVHVESVSAGRRPIVTRHGLRVVAGRDAADPNTPPPELILIPSRSNSKIGRALTEPDPAQDAQIHRWIAESGASVKSFFYDAPGKSYQDSLSLLAAMKDEASARLVAKVLRLAPPAASSENFSFWLWLRPLLLAGLGLFLAWRVDVRIHRSN